jgi:DNA phosphorothioation-associated putative methyltransferase
MPQISRHRTAIHRYEFSRPIKLALSEDLITENTEVLDYGCGLGDDVRHLNTRGIKCNGWDPAYNSTEDPLPADAVNLGYVVNVIEDAVEREHVLRRAWNLTRKVLIVSARHSLEKGTRDAAPYADGCVTDRGTFQKYYTQDELRNWIQQVLDKQPFPAGPGIFYVFRDEDTLHSYLAARYKRRFTIPKQRKSDLLFEKHNEMLQPLMDFIALRGRIPDDMELQNSSDIRATLGSIARAVQVIRIATGAENWDRIFHERSQELLIYLALLKFDGRPKFHHLPVEQQLDIRAMFSNYKRACDEADKLLFSAGDHKKREEALGSSSIGKLTLSALYVHADELYRLPTVLRIYEGCARGYIGAVDGANIIKLHRLRPQISYLSYPEFEKVPHPTLNSSLKVHLDTFHVSYRDYAESTNPFILHRKEEFVSTDNHLHSKFSKLTRQEERYGLFENPAEIGTLEGWQSVLKTKGVKLRGHRLTLSRK